MKRSNFRRNMFLAVSAILALVIYAYSWIPKETICGIHENREEIASPFHGVIYMMLLGFWGIGWLYTLGTWLESRRQPTGDPDPCDNNYVEPALTKSTQKENWL